mmetsp:Transcript_185/g.563  ORF Transcript_185/g.563 Transcript_185/m.563 type:complete len:238 (-) Transcript_185:702-1415(-)
MLCPCKVTPFTKVVFVVRFVSDVSPYKLTLLRTTSGSANLTMRSSDWCVVARSPVYLFVALHVTDPPPRRRFLRPLSLRPPLHRYQLQAHRVLYVPPAHHSVPTVRRPSIIVKVYMSIRWCSIRAAFAAPVVGNVSPLAPTRPGKEQFFVPVIFVERCATFGEMALRALLHATPTLPPLLPPFLLLPLRPPSPLPLRRPDHGEGTRPCHVSQILGLVHLFIPRPTQLLPPRPILALC